MIFVTGGLAGNGSVTGGFNSVLLLVRKIISAITNNRQLQLITFQKNLSVKTTIKTIFGIQNLITSQAVTLLKVTKATVYVKKVTGITNNKTTDFKTTEHKKIQAITKNRIFSALKTNYSIKSHTKNTTIKAKTR